MPNLYATLEDIKDFGMLNITGTSTDTVLLDCLEESSRQIETDTDRFFYIYEGTFYQDGGGVRVILDWDVQTISTLKCDTDGDRVYESTYTVNVNVTTSPDAFLYPLNRYPKTRLEANPYGDYGSFAPGIQNAIEITGVFGYGNDWPAGYTHSTNNTLTAAVNSTATTLPVSGATTGALEVGQTMRMTSSTPESEQIFVISKTASTSYVIQRAVNGTTAIGTAATSATFVVYDYPQPIRRATLISAARGFKRRESAYANVISNPLTGEISVWKGVDPDYAQVIKQYRKPRGWYLF